MIFIVAIGDSGDPTVIKAEKVGDLWQEGGSRLIEDKDQTKDDETSAARRES